MLAVLGEMLRARQFPEALALLDAVLAQVAAVPPEGDPRLARASLLASKATVLLPMGNHAAAAAVLKEARQLFEAAGRSHAPEMVTVLGNLAAARRGLGEEEAAVRLWEEALALLRADGRGEVTEDECAMVQAMAAALGRLQRFDACVDRMRELVRLREQLYGKDHVSTVRAVRQLAECETAMWFVRVRAYIPRQSTVLLLLLLCIVPVLFYLALRHEPAPPTSDDL